MPRLANTYVDDTIGWATGPTKEEVAGCLRYQLYKMVSWCNHNKIKINADKTHVLFNESNDEDHIEIEQMRINTTKSIKYLGAELTANQADHSSTILINTTNITKKISRDVK